MGDDNEPLLLEALADSVRIRRGLEEHERTLVALLRQCRPPASWESIGRVYGQTAEGARRRFSHRAGPSKG